MKKTTMILLAALAMVLMASPACAQMEFGEVQIYHYPEIEPYYTLKGGYWLSNVNGSRRAAEYYYLEDSPSFGAMVIAFPFPHRVHLEVDLINAKDYFSDLRYTYKDTIMLRAVSRSVFHNTENIELVQTDGTAPLRLDTGEVYGLRAALGQVKLRLKTPDFPLHGFAEIWYMDKEGDRQSRFIGGAAYFSNRPRVTERREVDSSYTDITAGINSHLGPVEAQYSHSERDFSPENGVRGFDYAAGGGRPAGTYPHSVVPDLKGRTDEIKVHTSYTGRLVASGTFSASDDENETSSAGTEYYIAAGEVVWTPVSKFTTALRYRYEKRDVDNPDSLPDGFLGFADFSAVTGIRNSISADINTVSLTSRYRPTNRVTVGADASYRHTDRENADEWSLEDSTGETSLGASLRVRLSSKLRFKARYKYKEYDDPAYNTQADDSHSGDFSVTWIPAGRVVVFAGYGLTRESRDHLHILVGGDDVGAEDRQVFRDRVTTVVTFVLREDLSLTGTYAYWGNRVEQDVVYGNSVDPANPFVDPGVEYEDNTWNYSASVDYSPLEQLDLHAGVSFTEAKAAFDPGTTAALQPISLSSFSKLKLRERAYDFEAKYNFPEDLDLGFRFEYKDFDEELENLNNPEMQDGTAQVYMVTLNKRW